VLLGCAHFFYQFHSADFPFPFSDASIYLTDQTLHDSYHNVASLVTYSAFSSCMILKPEFHCFCQFRYFGHSTDSPFLKTLLTQEMRLGS